MFCCIFFVDLRIVRKHQQFEALRMDFGKIQVFGIIPAAAIVQIIIIVMSEFMKQREMAGRSFMVLIRIKGERHLGKVGGIGGRQCIRCITEGIQLIFLHVGKSLGHTATRIRLRWHTVNRMMPILSEM